MNVLLKLYDCDSPLNRLLLEDYASGLTRRHHHAVVAARSFRGLRPPLGVAARRVGLGRRLAWLDFILVGWQMARLCRRHRIDVVHFVAAPEHDGLWDYLALAVFRLLSRVPVVVACHQQPRTLHAGLLASPWFDWTADLVTVPSPALKSDMRALHPTLDPKVRSVFNAVSGPPRPYLLALSRVTREKGIDSLLFAFAGLLQRGHDVDLAICGALPRFLGFRLVRYEKLAERLGIADRVHFWGHLEPRRAAQLLQGCLFFVLPSRREGHSLALLEAMAAGKAVVATKVGGAEATVEDGRDGLLVPPEDCGALEGAMDRLMSDRSLRERLGRAGRERVARDFTWDAHARACEEVYREALARP
ncbi:MAG: glycosyltransferase family 4 protein [Elusimicrobiota bacterium]